MNRRVTRPRLQNSFDQVFERLSRQPLSRSPHLQTTGTAGVDFVGEAGITSDGRRFISLPHSNRIYKDDWGYTTNSMGKDGQRIGQYSVPLDQWVTSTSGDKDKSKREGIQ